MYDIHSIIDTQWSCILPGSFWRFNLSMVATAVASKLFHCRKILCRYLLWLFYIRVVDCSIRVDMMLEWISECVVSGNRFTSLDLLRCANRSSAFAATFHQLKGEKGSACEERICKIRVRQLHNDPSFF